MQQSTNLPSDIGESLKKQTKNLRKFHAHEKPTHEERDSDKDKCNSKQKYSVQSPRRWLVGLI